MNNIESLVIQNNSLYLQKYFSNNDKLIYQFVVPKSKTKVVFNKLHTNISGGHLGFEKTIKKIEERFFWPYMNMADHYQAGSNSVYVLPVHSRLNLKYF